MVYARRGGFTVQNFRNNKSKIKVLSISMADAGIPTPDPEIEFRREVDLDDIGQGTTDILTIMTAQTEKHLRGAW